MTWLSVTTGIFYYVSLPITFILSNVLGLLLVVLAPLVHLGHYTLSATLVPLGFLSKFETLYIYFGVAALIGIITGSILHLSSTVLISLFDLKSTPEETYRSAASVRAAQEQKRLEDAWQSSSSPGDQDRPPPRKNYTDWLEKDMTKRRENQELLRQTIIEEDDDSEDGF